MLRKFRRGAVLGLFPGLVLVGAACGSRDSANNKSSSQNGVLSDDALGALGAGRLGSTPRIAPLSRGRREGYSPATPRNRADFPS